jgi:hypothetical protein
MAATEMPFDLRAAMNEVRALQAKATAALPAGRIWTDEHYQIAELSDVLSDWLGDSEPVLEASDDEAARNDAA